MKWFAFFTALVLPIGCLSVCWAQKEPEPGVDAPIERVSETEDEDTKSEQKTDAAEGSEKNEKPLKNDPAVKALLDKMRLAYQNSKALNISSQVTVKQSIGDQTQELRETNSLMFLAPNRFHLSAQTQIGKESYHFKFISDGKIANYYNVSRKTYLTDAAPAKEQVAVGLMMNDFLMPNDPIWSLVMRGMNTDFPPQNGAGYQYLGQETYNGITVEVIRSTVPPPASEGLAYSKFEVKFGIGAKDFLIRYVRLTGEAEQGGQKLIGSFNVDATVNPTDKLTLANFVFTPPSGVKCLNEPKVTPYPNAVPSEPPPISVQPKPSESPRKKK